MAVRRKRATAPARPLGATYRMQLHEEFPLDAARERVEYLRALGVTHLYASPVLRARAGSRHGYDVVDPTLVNPEIGGDDAWRALADALHAAGLGVVLDVVPNHMGAGPDNPYWVDVLRHGKKSRWAHWFDIDWNAPAPYRHRVMLPVLGDELDAVLERGELTVVEEDGERWLKYFDNRYPVHPDTPRDLPVEEVVRRQHYRLAFWRRAATEINYRRFFDVNDLAALHAEDPKVFAETHARVLEWVADGTLDGIRIDHVDGLLDPRKYLERLRAAVAKRTRSRGIAGRDYPIFVEKILSPGERLREEWPVQGTTGYEFLNLLEDTFVNAAGFRAIEAWYRRLLAHADGGPKFEEEAVRGKREILRGALRADVTRLARLARALKPPAGDVEGALVEAIACLPVYRTYIDASGRVHPQDAEFLARARARARARGDAVAEVLDWLFARFADGEASRSAARTRMIARFQQTSGPATAKGVEDTALYRYFPLASRNEVGGAPEQPLDDAVRRFHAANAERQRAWPRSLLCTNTHDTKRSADVRARLAALSEVAEDWLAAVDRWREHAAPLRATTAKGPAPDADDEYLVYQTLVGAWPVLAPGASLAGEERAAFRGRVKAYMEKAMRESKRITTWTEPDEAYERGVAAFVDGVLADGSVIGDEIAGFATRITRPAMWTSLARVALHVTSPGTPDVYQGDELWNLALVDPDNRRPVNYGTRAESLAALDAREAEGDDARARLLSELLARPEDGRVKLWTVSRLLRARRDRLGVFADGEYRALDARGRRAPHVVAFARVAPDAADGAAITIAPRMALTLADNGPPVAGVWEDTEVSLPDRVRGARLRCALSGARLEVRDGRDGPTISVADALRSFPVAVLFVES